MRIDGRWFAILALLLSSVLALKLGAVDTASASFELIRELRLPRVVLAIAVGAGLALAGTVLQALFANPLCEPYTLGISSGSALGAVLALGTPLEGGSSGVALPAFLGAGLFAAILLLIARRSGSRGLTLLLAGVMLSLVGSSLVALWMALSDPEGVHAATFWLMGDLSRSRLAGAVAILGFILLCFVPILRSSRELDALMLGEDQAEAVGLDVARSRKKLLLLSSLIVGACVSAAGMIGFVGLVVPHFVRRSTGGMHGRTLPLAALWGAAVLVLADMTARTLAAPVELPVGVVTALVGAPLFVWILIARRGSA